MAFTVSRAEMAYTLQPGDRLFLYTSRGCFHNPTRDRGRVVGEARVRSPVVELRKAVHVAGREFALACDLEIRSLAPLGKGLELAPLVPRLRAFPRPQSWSVMMRRPLLALPAPDAKLIDSLLRKVAGAPEGGRQTYLDAAVVTIS
jgi:hypothetical protein